jgi:hypothetical protein
MNSGESFCGICEDFQELGELLVAEAGTARREATQGH